VKISETSKTTHEIACIQWKGIDDKIHEKWVDIHKTQSGELLDVSIDRVEISAFDLEVLAFLKKEGKI